MVVTINSILLVPGQGSIHQIIVIIITTSPWVPGSKCFINRKSIWIFKQTPTNLWQFCSLAKAKLTSMFEWSCKGNSARALFDCWVIDAKHSFIFAELVWTLARFSFWLLLACVSHWELCLFFLWWLFCLCNGSWLTDWLVGCLYTHTKSIRWWPLVGWWIVTPLAGNRNDGIHAAILLLLRLGFGLPLFRGGWFER